jgi:hypothetical protein
MDGAEDPTIARARRLAEVAFPGLCARLEKLGGRYLAPKQGSKVMDTKRETITGLIVSLACFIPAKLVRVSLTVTAKRDTDETWRIVQCAYECAPCTESGMESGERHFGICDNRHEGFHVHLRSHPGHHRASKARPDVTKRPEDFLAMVETFLETGELPFTVTP